MSHHHQQILSKAALKAHLVPIALALLSLMIAVAGPSVAEWLRYDRQHILAWQLWRLVSAHMVHLGWNHALMNLAGLILIWVLFWRFLSSVQWLWILLISAVGTSLGLLWLQPQLSWYVGLSGVLHGLFAAGALASAWSGHRLELLLLLGLGFKLAWEQVYGPLPGSAEFAGGAVIVHAHLYGAISGVLAVLVVRLKASVKP